MTDRGRSALPAGANVGETGLEKSLGSVLDAVAEGIEIIDSSGYCSFANLAAERVFGPREGIIGRRYDDTRWRLMTPEGVPISHEEMPQSHVMRTGEPVLDTLFRAILPDGRQVGLTMNAVPFPDEGGRLVGMLVSYTDVTQRSRTERFDGTLLDIGAAVNSSFDFDDPPASPRSRRRGPRLRERHHVSQALDDVPSTQRTQAKRIPSSDESVGVSPWPREPA